MPLTLTPMLPSEPLYPSPTTFPGSSTYPGHTLGETVAADTATATAASPAALTLTPVTPD